jgi:hypothetical protein
MSGNCVHHKSFTFTTIQVKQNLSVGLISSSEWGEIFLKIIIIEYVMVTMCFLGGRHRDVRPYIPTDFVVEPKNKVTAKEV